MHIIGIDPGISGGVAIFNLGGYNKNTQIKDIILTETPFIKTTKKKKNKKGELVERVSKVYAESAMAKVLKVYSEVECHVFMEKVGAMPDQGVVSMFNFGTGYGVWKGIIAAYELPYTLVTPQAWKKELMQGISDKDAARLRAQQLFPKMSESLRFKKDIGKADALLIAEFGRRIHK